jgi:FdhD protein
MQVSAVISRTTPTDLAVELAKRYGLTLIGYARGKRCIVFSSPAEFAKPDA